MLWWSGFTSLTGLVTSYYPLLLTRFLFGMGEAGATPNAAVAVARWFPIHERGRAFGFTLMASQFGGAIAPLLVVPIQVHYGWRASFYVFGVLGVAWSAVWYWWFRDTPKEKAGVTEVELNETRGLAPKTQHGLPWMIALRSENFWATMGVAFCYRSRQQAPRICMWPISSRHRRLRQPHLSGSGVLVIPRKLGPNPIN